MKLNELQAPLARHKIITYARDHNTAVEKYKDLQPVCGNLYKGKSDADDYGQVTCRLYIFYDALNIGMDLGAIYYPDEKDVDEIVSRVHPALLQGPEALIAALDHAVETGRYITNAEIALARHIAPDKVPVYIAARQRHIDLSEERRAAERAAQEVEDAEYCEKRNAETENTIKAALETIRSGGILKNDTIHFHHSCYDCRSYSIINYLARQYGAEFPLKVQGWINKRLVQVTVHNGKATQYRYTGGKSNTFMDYMDQLLAAIGQREADGCEYGA